MADPAWEGDGGNRAVRVPKASALVAGELRRQIVRGAVHHDDHAQFLAAREASRRIEKTEDYREGPRSFVEKRPPNWKGR